MGVFSRSWQITKLSFSVIGKDKEMLAFPVLSGIFSIIFLIALLFPTIIVGFINNGSFQGGIIEYILLFIVYLGLVFIATFFNVATVYTVKIRFEGGNATFMDSIKFAFSKIHLVFMWAVVSAVVGIILRVLDQLAKNMKGGGKLFMNVIRGILGAAWGIVTIFVVPILVYKGLGPFDAIKESGKTIKKTWGESLVRHFGLGLIQVIVLILEIILFVILAIILGEFGGWFLVGVFLFGVIMIVLTVLVFGIANIVYNTALYVYAQTGEIPDGFNSEVLAEAFEKQKN